MAVVQQWDLSLLATLGGALGDATRFAMFEHVMTSSDPVSAGETAAVFGLHRTVARSHLEKLAERHGFEAAHSRIALTGGSDDHGALDIADTWTQAPGASLEEFLAAVRGGWCEPAGTHGSTLKLAHAVG